MTRNTAGAPAAASNNPPIAGPSMMPRLRPTAMRLFAQLTWSSGTRFGIAAPEAGQNGASANADSRATKTSGPGTDATAIPAKHTAAARSERIITLRRSNRSPNTPVSGATTPVSPSVTSNDAASHAADPVLS